MSDIDRNRPLGIINLWGPPGAGKSALAAGVFHRLKIGGANVEIIQEAAKDWIYEGNTDVFADQAVVLHEQNRRQWRLRGHCDLAITDSPLLLCPFYEERERGPRPALRAAAVAMQNDYRNSHYWVRHRHGHIHAGRRHDANESEVIGPALQRFLEEMGIACTEILLWDNPIDRIISDLVARREWLPSVPARDA